MVIEGFAAACVFPGNKSEFTFCIGEDGKSVCKTGTGVSTKLIGKIVAGSG